MDDWQVTKYFTVTVSENNCSEYSDNFIENICDGIHF